VRPTIDRLIRRLSMATLPGGKVAMLSARSVLEFGALNSYLYSRDGKVIQPRQGQPANANRPLTAETILSLE
jgi:hypothetical protein